LETRLTATSFSSMPSLLSRSLLLIWSISMVTAHWPLVVVVCQMAGN
jgi:hypothetical protein